MNDLGEPTDGNRSSIVIENRGEWFGDQRLGAFHVSLDGTKVGVVFPGQTLNVEAAPGPHVLRLRQWWYRSAPVKVDIALNGRVRMGADVIRSRSLPGRMMTLMLRPSHSLTLVEIPHDG